MRLEWVATGHGGSGVDRGVLYLDDGTGVPWNGLTSVIEKPEDTIQTDLYFDGVRFGFAQSAEAFGLGVEAWAYPTEFEEFDGLIGDIQTRQPRKPFGFSYRVDMNGYYEIHLVWNATAMPSAKRYSSRNNEHELSLFQWDFATTPKRVNGVFPTAHFVAKTNTAPAEAIVSLEDALYGTDLTDPHLPEPEEVINLFLDHAVLVVTDNGDGTWTATGPDDIVYMLDANTFQIKSPSALYITPERYQVSSM